MTYILRPLASGQQLRWLARCTFIDGYLYSTQSKLYYLLEVRGKGSHALPDLQFMYSLERDIFGLFTETRLYAAPQDRGAPIVVDDLKALTGTERAQLRRLLVLLAMALRASMEQAGRGARYSTVIHALQPRPCDPLDGVRNHYAQTGRAARDKELARRVAASRK